MKLILAFVQPFKLDDVTRKLQQVSDFPGMTVGAVRGFGREHVESPRKSAAEQLEDYTEKVHIETIVHDDQVDAVVEAIAGAAHTGRYGDGMIFVLPVERAVRIATLGQGDRAV